MYSPAKKKETIEQLFAPLSFIITYVHLILINGILTLPISTGAAVKQQPKYAHPVYMYSVI